MVNPAFPSRQLVGVFSLELARQYGYLYQGQAYSWQEAPRGYPSLDLKPEAFVSFLENHDQVSNSATGDRLRLQTSPGRYRAMTALLLLGPWTPLLFQGEEFGASTPFLYFSEVGDEKLREAVKKGRFEFLAQFPSATSAGVTLAVPYEIETFRRCKLDWSEREKNHAFSNLHRDLIKLRHEDSRLCQQSKGRIDGAVLRSESFIIRYLDEVIDDRLLIVNFGGREELMQAVIVRWDEDAINRNPYSPSYGIGLDEYVTTIGNNVARPGIVHLYLAFAAEALESSYPAHEFIRKRFGHARNSLAGAIRREQEVGKIVAEVDAEIEVRPLIALADGLQLQSLIDPGVDAVAHIATAIAQLRTGT